MHIFSRLARFLDIIIQPPCGPGAYTLAEKKIEKRNRESTAAAASSSKHSGPRVGLFRRTSRKKKTEAKKKQTAQRGPGASASIMYLVLTASRAPSRKPRTNWRWGLLHKAVTTRGGCVAHMLLRSCLDVRRPRYLSTAVPV